MAPQTEQELLDATIALAMHARWAVTHFRAAATRRGYRTAIQGHVGFPDLALARTGVVWLWELKGPKGKPSSEQLDWGRQIGPDHYRLLRPSDWGWIVATLTAKAARPLLVDAAVEGLP